MQKSLRDSKGRFAKRKKGKGIMALIVPMILVGGLYGAHGVAVAIDSVEPEVIVVEQKVEEIPRTVLVEGRPKWTQERIKQQVEETAQKYNVSAVEMWNVIMCESKDPMTGYASTSIQSYHYKNGVRENSWGLAQIHLDSHPTVTKKQAIDPKFAIDFMAKHFANGDKWMWTCWKILYN